jgi:3-oxoacyl-[acyl-carrier-protein] synthase II
MDKRAVAITGLGVLSPIGQSPAEVASSLRSGRSGIAAVQLDPLEKAIPAGIVVGTLEEAFTRLERPFMDRVQHFAVLAARQAITDAGIEDFAGYGLRAGVYYGNVNGGAASVQSWAQNLLNEGKQASRPFTAMAIMSNGGAAQISIRNKILGPVLTHGSACGASGVAIGEAARAIADGYLDIAVAGGSEAPLSAMVSGVFSGTRAMSAPDPADASRSCKPFAKARSGLVLGEGGAFVILESEAHARARNATIHGYLRGYGVSSDASHIGMPAVEGQVRALQAALLDAGLDPNQIQYINAHATATDGGDVIESESIRTVFGDGPGDAWVSSTKAVHGHLLGAASALELVVTILAMRNSILPASVHMDEADPRCALNHVGPSPRTEIHIENALSFSCGFGGTNAALIVSRRPKSA